MVEGRDGWINCNYLDRVKEDLVPAMSIFSVLICTTWALMIDT